MSRIISRAEGWEKIHQAFTQINFAAYDYNTVKQSLLDYIRLSFPENFNDFIETSELVALIETFAYVAEQTAYRLDLVAHENFIGSAQRKDSILRLAKLVSYTASRPIPARGLVKITSISTTENVVDVNGVDLTNRTITWNDIANNTWRDQFILVMNRVLTQNFGNVGASDRFQLQDVLFEIYGVNHAPLAKGVFGYNAVVNGTNIPMELVPVEYNALYGIVERRPDIFSKFTLLYGSDGQGNASPTTGFFMYTKQGTLQRSRASFDGITSNQSYVIPSKNVNDTDIWVNEVDPDTGVVKEVAPAAYQGRKLSPGRVGEWMQVDIAHAQNIIFNTNPYRNKYEVETLTDNQARLVFGDGEFANIPSGTFDVWARVSEDKDYTIPQNTVNNVPVVIPYVDKAGRPQTATFTFSLISTLQNASKAEDMERVRVAAPAIYYTQDRMVNAEDYNVFMMQDPSILKLRSVNRTFAGDSKYVSWHDGSESYEHVKIFGDDAALYFQDRVISEMVSATDISTLVGSFIEPLLSSTDVFLRLVTSNVPVSQVRRVFNVSERSLLTTALQPPPAPVSVSLYYNIVDYDWHPVKSVESPTLLVGWPEEYIQTPLITIEQQPQYNDRYLVSRVSRRMVIQSDATKFWNTNSANRVLSYDTKQSVVDEVVLLSANTNNSRTATLSRAWRYNVLGQETIDAGTEAGLSDIHRISVLPADENNDGVPDHLDVGNIVQRFGTAELMHPKITINTATSTFPLVVTLPVYYLAGQGDIVVYDGNGNIVTGTWSESPDPVSNTITLLENNVTSSFSILVREYVYFSRNTTVDPWIISGSSVGDVSSYYYDVLAGANLWKRHEGKTGLNFMWLHRSPRYHLVDPAPSNIIDTFVITRGYYISHQQWLEDPLAARPISPSSFDLRNAYQHLLVNKMVSDAVVVHPGRFKVLFGPKAPSELQATIKVVKSPTSTLTDNQIKSVVVSTVRQFFDVTSWEFGETFYFTELSAAIHNAMPLDIKTAVLVPTYAQHGFGNLFQIPAREDEVFQCDIGVSNVEIIGGLNASSMKVLV